MRPAGEKGRRSDTLLLDCRQARAAPAETEETKASIPVRQTEEASRALCSGHPKITMGDGEEMAKDGVGLVKNGVDLVKPYAPRIAFAMASAARPSSGSITWA